MVTTNPQPDEDILFDGWGPGSGSTIRLVKDHERLHVVCLGTWVGAPGVVYDPLGARAIAEALIAWADAREKGEDSAAG